MGSGGAQFNDYGPVSVAERLPRLEARLPGWLLGTTGIITEAVASIDIAD